MKKSAYIARHRANENWKNPETAAYMALNMLWNRPTIEASWNWVKNDLRKKGYL